MSTKFLKRTALAALLLLLPVLAACGDSTPTSGTRAATNGSSASVTTAAGGSPAVKTKQSVKLALSYIPDVQFAPYYVAQDKGYFANEGLDVSFQYGTIDNLMTLVAQGQIPFALASGDEVLQARANGIPVTYVATQYQKYPVAIASLKSKGITQPADLKGKTIGIPGQFGANYIGLKAILGAAKLSESDVKIQAIGFTQREALTQGKVDAVAVYSMNEPTQLRAAGQEINVIEVSSLTNLSSIGLITSENLVNTQPELVQKMVRASTHGMKDMISDPDAAFDSTVKVAPDAKGSNPDLQRQILKETVKFMTAPSVKGQFIGYCDPQVWQTSAQFMLDNKLINNKVGASTVFTNKFISKEIGVYQ